jgi:MoaA/NifB/PqqE/SkfB family radical SAM enzyme
MISLNDITMRSMVQPPISTSLRQFVNDERCRFKSINSAGRRIVIRLTYRCDLACPHCLVGENLYRNDGELNYHEWAQILSELPEIQARKVLLTGGEPLLHKDVVRLCRLISQMGIPVDLNSNLQKMSKGLMEEFANAGLTEISVSIEGPSQIHNEMHGRNNALEKTLQALHWATEMGIKADASCCLTSKNLPALPELLELVDSLPIESFTISRLLPIGHGPKNLNDTIPQSKLEEVHHQLFAEWIPKVHIPVRLVGLLGAPTTEHCTRGTGLIGVTPKGELLGCFLAKDNPNGIAHPLDVGLKNAVDQLCHQLTRREYALCYS